jgi:hypothetical protein
LDLFFSRMLETQQRLGQAPADLATDESTEQRRQKSMKRNPVQ